MAGSITANADEYLEKLGAMLAQVDREAIDAYADVLFRAWKDDRAVCVFGNGGSAACASHHVSDYVKTAEVEGQRRLRAFCLSDNTPMMSAIGNDLSYDDIFVHQLESYARPGDVAVAISCSGNSPNVLKACDVGEGPGPRGRRADRVHGRQARPSGRHPHQLRQRQLRDRRRHAAVGGSQRDAAAAVTRARAGRSVVRALVTGGAGFIGSHTAMPCSQRGTKSASWTAWSRRSIRTGSAPAYLDPRIDLHVGTSVTRPPSSARCDGVDVVYHFAAFQDYLPIFSRFFDVNVTATALIYELIVRESLPIRKVVVATQPGDARRRSLPRRGRPGPRPRYPIR